MAGTMNSYLSEVKSGDKIHDYQHANKIFTSNGYELAPKHSFLFYARFTLNSEINQEGIFPNNKAKNVNVLVKRFTMPKFTVENKTLNAYNRPNIIQTKMKYDPVQITFHDDAGDNLRKFWYDYYSYYYRDSDYNESVYRQNTKYAYRQNKDWGYNPNRADKSDQHLISKIELFSFHNKRFSQFTLLNPIITSFSHGEHDYSNATGTLEGSMTVAYESVTYTGGQFTGDHFGDMLAMYDNRPSPLTPNGGGSNSLMGANGPTYADNATDNWGSKKGGGGFSLGGGLGNALLGMAAVEGIGLLKGALAGKNPLAGASFPSLSGIGNSISGAVSKAGEAISDVAGGVKDYAEGVYADISNAYNDYQLEKDFASAEPYSEDASWEAAAPNDLGDFYG